MRKKQVTERALFKYIVQKIKKIVMNNNGDTVYMDAFDDIIYNFYGVKKFSEKMSELWDDREFAMLINRVGLKNILTLLGYPKYYETLRELVVINTMLPKLRRKINRKRRNGKDDRELHNLVKEYRYLKKLSTKGEKALRKRLGIKGGNQSYKKKFGSIKSLVNEYHDRSWGGFDYDDDYYSSNLDFDDYDYDEASQMDDFLAELKGIDITKARNRSKQDQDDEYDFDLDDYYPDQQEEDSEVEKKVDELSSKMTQMNDVLMALASQNQYDRVNHRNPVTHQPAFSADSMSASDIVLQKQLQNINSSISSLASAVGNIESWRQNMDQILSEIDEEDDEYLEDDDSNGMFTLEEYNDVINRYPDLKSQIGVQPGTQKMSREELIAAINSEPPVEIPVEADDVSETVVVNQQHRFAGPSK